MKQRTPTELADMPTAMRRLATAWSTEARAALAPDRLGAGGDLATGRAIALFCEVAPALLDLANAIDAHLLDAAAAEARHYHPSSSADGDDCSPFGIVRPLKRSEVSEAEQLERLLDGALQRARKGDPA